MNQQKISTKATLRTGKNYYVQVFLFMIFAFKKKIVLTKKVSFIIQLLLNIQPLFITMECSKFISLQQFWFYKLLNFILRPDLIYDSEYTFLIPLSLMIIHKISAILLTYKYHKSQNYDRFLRAISHSFILKIISFLFGVYQLFISNYLFIGSGLFCIASLKKYINDFTSQQNNSFCIWLSLITIFFIIIESTLNLIYLESSITYQICGMERTRVTLQRILYHIFLLIQLFLVFLAEVKNIEYIQSIISILLQSCLLYDMFHNYTYIFRYQQNSILLGASINIGFHLQVFFYQGFTYKMFFLQFIICTLGINSIFKSFYHQFNGRKINMIFQFEKKSYYEFKFAILKLLNNDFIDQNQEIFIKSIISSKHRNTCNNTKCFFCQHYFILFPSQSCGITSQIFHDFYEKQIAVLAQLIQKHWKFENKSILQYSFFLYDFGYCMKSIQLLCYLNQQITYCDNNYQGTSNIYSKDQIQSLEFQSLNQTIIQEDLNNTFLANNQVGQKYQLSLIERTKLLFVFSLAKAKIYAHLGTSFQTTQQSYISEFINRNIQLDIFLSQKQSLVFSILEQKLELFKQVFNNPNSKGETSFRQRVFSICHQFYKIEKDLKISYQLFPSYKLHRIITFFYGEVLSDYKRAIIFYKNSNFVEANEVQFQQIRNFDINSQNIHYLILETKDDMQNLSICNYSSHFFQTFGYGKNKNDVLMFEDLLPNYLNFHHNNFVKKFFETGKAIYYQMFEVNLIKNRYKLLTSINMCFSITNQFKNENITFAVFIQQASSDQVYIFVDCQTLKCTFTFNLLTLLGWFTSDIDAIVEQEQFDDFPINKIFPNFQKISRTNKLLQFKFSKNFLLLPKPNYSLPTSRSPNYENQKLQVKYTQTECDLKINKKKIANYEYFIINVLRLNETYHINQQQTAKFMPQSSKLSDELNYSPISSDNQEMIFKINSISFRDKQLPTSILVCKETQMSMPQNQKEKKSVFFTNNNTIFLSPRTSTNKFENQQKFFTDVNSENELEDQQNLSSQNNVGNKKKHKQRKQTTIATDAYFSNEKVSKKYELIQKVLALGHPKYLQKLMCYMILWHSVFLLFILIFTISMQQDILKAKHNMEMSTFYYAIMAPHDLFFSMRVTITAYQQMQREGFLTIQQSNSLTQPYYEFIDLGYIDFRDNFYEQLNNQYLQEFLNEVRVSLYFMKENEKTIYPIDMQFRDALFVILQYQYSQMMTFYYHQSTSGKPFQISLFANYFMLHNQCEQLTLSIQSYSIEDATQTIRKWQIIFAIGFVITFAFYLLVHSNQVHYFFQIDKLFQLTSSFTVETLQPEIKKYQQFIEEYSQDRHCLDNYEPFDYFYSYFLKYETEKKKQVLKIKNNSLKNSRSVNYVVMMFLFFMMLLYFCMNLVSFQIYVSKYDNTLNLYLQLQELKLRSGSLYLYREIFFRWQNFTFLTQENKQDLYSLINKAENSIEGYINLTNFIVFSDYQLDDDFVEIFQSISEQYFCKYIDQKFSNLTSRYCELAFEGSIKKGLIYTLNYINNAIKTQQEINNFTKRVVAELYEQEGSQIVTRVFFTLCEQFMKNTTNLTQDTLKMIKILSFFFISYVIILLILLQMLYRPYLIWLFKSLKRIVYLVPFTALVQSENLEIQLRELTYQLQLI